MPLRGNTRNLRDHAARLKKIASVETAERIARLGAEQLTAQMRSDFDAGNTAYGDGRPDGFHGSVDLVKSGKLRSYLSFAAVGRRIRCVLAVAYAKFMVGRFQVLPRGGGALPYKWSEALDALTKRVLDETAGAR